MSDYKMTDVRMLYTLNRGEDDKCFFCDRVATNTYYQPLLKIVKIKGLHGDMQAYHVCVKCMVRCDTHRGLDHKDLQTYINALESKHKVLRKKDLTDKDIINVLESYSGKPVPIVKLQIKQPTDQVIAFKMDFSGLTKEFLQK